MTSLDKSYRLIKKPLISEKSYSESHNLYSFRVPLTANKIEIRQAIEQIFEVKVKRVNTLRTKSKWKIRGRTIGRTQQWKKAMVTLHEGSKIEIF